MSGQVVSPLPSLSGYLQQQGQQGQDRKHCQGKTMDGNGGKWSRKENKEEEEDRRPNPSNNLKDYESEWTLYLVYIKTLVLISDNGLWVSCCKY